MSATPSLPDTLESIPAALAFWATTTPDAVALVAPGRPPTTYHELHGAVDRLAGDLRALGLGRQDGVALLFPDGPDLCLATLAAMAAGIAVPLAWPAPATEYRRMLANRRIRAVLVSAEIPPSALGRQDPRHPVITLSSGPSGRLRDFLLEGQRWADPSPAVAPDREDIAVLLHSSGTTGPSKLIPLLHRNTVASYRIEAAARAFAAADRCLNPAKLAYSLGLITFLVTIFSGATFISVPGPDLGAMSGWLETYRPTYLVATPALLRTLAADNGELRQALRRAPVRCITTSAAPLAASEAPDLESALGAPILGIYGLSEASCIASEPYPALHRVPGSVGVARCEVRIVDRFAEPLDPRQAGEIVVRHGVILCGFTNFPALMPSDASNFYARNVYTFLMLMLEKLNGEWRFKDYFADEITQMTLITHQGKVRFETTKNAKKVKVN